MMDVLSVCGDLQKAQPLHYFASVPAELDAKTYVTVAVGILESRAQGDLRNLFADGSANGDLIAGAGARESIWVQLRG